MPNVFQTYDEKDAKTLFCTQNVSFILQTSDYSTVSQKILSKCPQLYWRIKEKKLFNCHRLIVIFSPTLAPLQLGRGEYITMTLLLYDNRVFLESVVIQWLWTFAWYLLTWLLQVFDSFYCFCDVVDREIYCISFSII